MKKKTPIIRQISNNHNISELEKIEKYLQEKYQFRYNVISNEVEFKPHEILAPYKPIATTNFWRELVKAHFRINISMLEALFTSDYVPHYDPFLEYFNELPSWSPTTNPDHINELASYVQTKDSERFSRHLKKHLVRTVACAVDKDFFNKHALILIGKKQNTGKSTFCRFLIPDSLADYYTENFETDKDGEIAMSRNLIINLDELASLNKADIKKLKALFSYIKINRRHPYGRKPIITPRRASFFGSTNETDFLEDETGSVRWLCFEIDSIDWNYTSLSNDDIWAQAYSLYKNDDYDYQLTQQEIKENERINKAYLRPTPERDLLNKFYEPGSEDDFNVFYQTTELLDELNTKIAIGIRLNFISLGKALVALGYERKSKRLPGKNSPIYGYYLKFKDMDSHTNDITLPAL